MQASQIFISAVTYYDIDKEIWKIIYKQTINNKQKVSIYWVLTLHF